MGEHSPGPWRWEWHADDRDDNDETDWRILRDADGKRLLSEILAVSDANARLIAAAPRLLAALREWSSYPCDTRSSMAMPSNACELMPCRPCRTRALLAELSPPGPTETDRGEGR